MIDVPVEVKDALREGTYKKNYRFVVLNEDGTPDEQVGTIDNNYLVSESVSIDERMCSGDTLKFGLCEGSSLEFQYFNKPNITGKRVQAFVDVQYRAGIMGRINASGSFTAPVNGSYTFEVKKGSATGLYITYAGGGDMYVDFVLGQTTDTEELEAGDVVTLNNPSSDALFEVSTDMWDTIPMGFFDVKKCSRQASTGIIKATCYNKLQSEYLDAKANNNEAFEYYWGTNDKSLTLFELLSALLQGYAVEPDYEEVHGTSNIDGIITNPNDEFSFYNISLRLRSKYGVDSCMSYYQWVNNNNDPNYLTDVHPFIVSRVRIYNTDKTYRLCKSLIGNFEELEQTVYNRLVEEYDRANFTDSNGNHISGTTIVDGMYSEFSNIIGATVEETIYKSGAIGKRYDYYSTVMYEYEEAHGISHTRAVSGFSGYYDHTYRLRELFVDLLPQNFKFHIPWQIGIIAQNSSSSTLNGLIYSPIDGINRQYLVSNTYRYYTDSSLTTYEEKTMSGMLTPIGTEYNAYERYQQVFALDENEMDSAYKIVVNPSQLADFTLRDLQSAAFETDCTFGQLSRTTDLFSGVELNHSRLYPADSLYPATDLYPNGAAVSGFKSMYSKLWADEGNIHKWRYLIITYKGLNEDQQEEDFTLQKTINNDGTDDYNMSDNWLFRNLVWTYEQVEAYALAMVAKMQDVTWFPFEMWCAGLPYLETGDEIEIPLNGESYTSYVLQRQLKGIQNLQDTYINGTLDIF